MNLKQKIGILMFLCAMTAAAALLWYLLLVRGKNTTQFDGTFVRLPDAGIVQVAG